MFEFICKHFEKNVKMVKNGEKWSKMIKNDENYSTIMKDCQFIYSLKIGWTKLLIV